MPTSELGKLTSVPRHGRVTPAYGAHARQNLRAQSGFVPKLTPKAFEWHWIKRARFAAPQERWVAIDLYSAVSPRRSRSSGVMGVPETTRFSLCGRLRATTMCTALQCLRQ